jgi:hypothetical protein
MKGIFWNIRGFGNKGLGPYVRDMAKANKFDFMCFQETILKYFVDKCLRKVGPSRDYFWDWIPVKGRSRVVLTGLKIDRFDVGSRSQGRFILHHYLWDKKLEVK